MIRKKWLFYGVAIFVLLILIYGDTEATATRVIRTSDGYVIICYGLDGRTIPNIDNDIWFVKTDLSGTMQWIEDYGFPNDQKAYSAIQTDDGGFAIAGSDDVSSLVGQHTSDAYLVKTDSLGKMEWSNTYGGENPSDCAYSLVQTSDGGYALAGEIKFSVDDEWKFWLIKTNDQGIIPEFPSWMIPPLLLTTTLMAILARRRLVKTRESEKT